MSEHGQQQALSVAGRLAQEALAAVYSSPRERAMQTAAAIGARAGHDVRTEDALDEIDFGRWTGARFDELQGNPLWGDWNYQRGTAVPPNGESMSAAADRAFSFVAGSHERHDGQSIALVSHCDIIRGVIARAIGLSLDNMLRFDIDPASISTIVAGAWGARVISVNERVAP